ncbi:MAG: hypothetical protein GY827_01300 [Cytophagales bacterium]|nr:hypothetical protein [Cytophagales bacterium]
MKYIIYSFLAVLLVSANQVQETTLDKAIKYHDSQAKWATLKDSFQLISNSKWSDWKDEHLTIHIDVAQNSLTYKNEERNIACQFTGDETTALIDSCDCSSYASWTKNFYTYIWGLPMKLKDEGTIVTEAKLVKFFGDSCHILKVSYEKEDWEYYFKKDTYYLAGFRFEMKGEKGGGEIVRHEGVSNWNGIITPTKRSWYDLDTTLLGTDKFTLEK